MYRALEHGDPRLTAWRLRAKRALWRWWCRSVAEHWRTHGAIAWSPFSSEPVHCRICGAVFRDLADAHGVDEYIARVTRRRINREAAMRDKRHGGPRDGEHFERVRRIER